jgi:hypothetical protein
MCQPLFNFRAVNSQPACLFVEQVVDGRVTVRGGCKGCSDQFQFAACRFLVLGFGFLVVVIGLSFSVVMGSFAMFRRQENSEQTTNPKLQTTTENSKPKTKN